MHSSLFVRACSRLKCGLHSSFSTSVHPTDLFSHIKRRIQIAGPLTIADYMREVLTNPLAGYYMKRDVFGLAGDFTTSPEISQMFGELIGIWCVNEWMQCGSHPKLQVVELGPGRGTLADDMLRVFSKFEAMKDVVSLHLVEVSPHLAAMQRSKLTEASPTSSPSSPSCDNLHSSAEHADDLSSSGTYHYQRAISKHGATPVYWYKQLPDVPRAPSFFVAHEFFDALPVHKFQKQDGAWREVMVDLTEGEEQLRFVLAPGDTYASNIILPDALHKDDPREHVEVCPESGVLAQELANRIAVDGGFGLIADYGHSGEKTDTFRAFHKHALHDPLREPGMADLTADVDFSYLTRMISNRASVYGPVTQESFLHNMGIGVRIQALMANATLEQRKSLITGYDMLTNPTKMGERFKFLALLRERPNDYRPAGFVPPT